MGVRRQGLNRAAIRALLTSPTGGVARDLYRRGLLVESAAKENLAGPPQRIDTGRLRASITTVLVSQGGVPSVRVGTNVEYAMFVHEGTGIYGPRGAPIVPVRARALRFKPKGAGRYVFALRVRGMQRNQFLKDALRAARS